MLRKNYRSYQNRVLWVISFLFLAMLGGCSSALFNPGKLVGQNEQAVTSAWGKPSARILMPDGGIRMQYSGQPWGRYVWNVDLAPNNTVYEIYQALEPRYFDQIPIDGSWQAQDVLRVFGPPAYIDHTYSWHGDIWNYRWQDNTHLMMFYIYFDGQGRVKRAHQGIDFSADRRIELH